MLISVLWAWKKQIQVKTPKRTRSAISELCGPVVRAIASKCCGGRFKPSVFSALRVCIKTVIELVFSFFSIFYSVYLTFIFDSIILMQALYKFACKTLRKKVSVQNIVFFFFLSRQRCTKQGSISSMYFPELELYIVWENSICIEKGAPPLSHATMVSSVLWPRCRDTGKTPYTTCLVYVSQWWYSG